MRKEDLILFIKCPDRAQVKSRLADSVGEERAGILYRYFVEDLLETLTGVDCRLRLYFDPPDAKEEVSRWLDHRYDLFPQQGGDLGEKMRRAFEETLRQGCRSALLIGSDVPDLTAGIFKEGFNALSVHDAVLGPSVDGGYYLIGFRDDTFRPEIFEGIPWSTNMVFQKTLEVFIALGDKVHILPPWRDIDVREDLKALMHRQADDPFRQSKTMRYLLNQRDFNRQD